MSRRNVLGRLPSVLLIPGIQGGQGLPEEDQAWCLTFLEERGEELVHLMEAAIVQYFGDVSAAIDHVKVGLKIDPNLVGPPAEHLKLETVMTLEVSGGGSIRVCALVNAAQAHPVRRSLFQLNAGARNRIQTIQSEALAQAEAIRRSWKHVYESLASKSLE